MTSCRTSGATPNDDRGHTVGLGRAATVACYELALVVESSQDGEELWQIAQRWREQLTSFPLVGLQAALGVAEKWGTPAELAVLRSAVKAEQERIFG